MDDKNTALQQEEHLAISAIYGDNSFSKDGPSSYLLSVPLDSTSANNQITLRFHFPASYPSTSPPVYELVSTYVGTEPISDDLRKEIDAKFGELWRPGEVVVFEWVEWLRERLESMHTEQGVETADASTREDVPEEEVDKVQSSFFEDDGDHKAAAPTQVGCPPIAHGEPLLDRKSVFLAHTATVTCVEEVHAVRSALLANKKIARATHPAIYAYRLRMANGTMLQDNDDDGEKAAGGRLLHLLQLLGVEDVVVFISRWYGGTLLGADRFKHINNVARALLEREGYIPQSAEKESTKKHNNKARR